MVKVALMLGLVLLLLLLVLELYQGLSLLNVLSRSRANGSISNGLRMILSNYITIIIIRSFLSIYIRKGSVVCWCLISLRRGLVLSWVNW